MVRSLTVEQFLQAPGVILDVRSPGEYEQGHIPEAVSFPLFTNEERAKVGTHYKQQGRDQAVELGFEIAGPKCADFVKQAKSLAPDRRVRVHCWRGGMRSGAISWILEMAGLDVSVLVGGYKAFRHWVLEQFQVPRSILILGGMTGMGKTDILSALTDRGAQVLDLENLANHRGSSYGNLGLPKQPSTEQFENLIAMQWARFNLSQPVWIEAESKRIGICRIPEALFQQMERSPVIEVTRPRSERLQALVNLYGLADRQELINATERIRKRLGGLRTQTAVKLIQENQLPAACDIILDYYDKTYTYDLHRRNVPIHVLDVTGLTPAESADRLLDFVQYKLAPPFPSPNSCEF
ncbi:tRNA 2-selenouridine(34) synthase MnmH [Thermocoleostomius sinensis]|uniref:tRNA 2-selenouridine(34) synthase MnmH n=1 Tax=Thermocoleostomius sinensis A174 TaxID=2016057 RepID=A0A9E8ZIG1_9CYAN|nr:tRNA 2-selenouridine(34) synthase MnmH [Thermocoleostomius sinensis]WAL62292.1 tRNA 2-selenouridine(34) synthase MnmH [Thermocoleostomius sinensis A174]